MRSHLLFYANNVQVNTERPSPLAVFVMSLIVVHDTELSNTVWVWGRCAWAIEGQGRLGFHTRVFAQFCLQGLRKATDGHTVLITLALTLITK